MVDAFLETALPAKDLLTAEKLGKDPIDIATLNLHGPESQTDPNPVPSYEACVAAVKKVMNWNWHQAGAKKLPGHFLTGADFGEGAVKLRI